MQFNTHDPQVTEALKNALVYAKQGTVRARRAMPGEVIHTKLSGGLHETTKTADGDSYVITNPGGEEYIIEAKKFEDRYAPTDEEGIYKATGLCRAYQNPTGEDIEIEASWGPQKGDAKCMIATLFNPEKPGELVGTPYLIGWDEFQATYKLR